VTHRRSSIDLGPSAPIETEECNATAAVKESRTSRTNSGVVSTEKFCEPAVSVTRTTVTHRYDVAGEIVLAAAAPVHWACETQVGAKERSKLVVLACHQNSCHRTTKQSMSWRALLGRWNDLIDKPIDSIAELASVNVFSRVERCMQVNILDNSPCVLRVQLVWLSIFNNCEAISSSPDAASMIACAAPRGPTMSAPSETVHQQIHHRQAGCCSRWGRCMIQ
jgi:hypothetical protein